MTFFEEKTQKKGENPSTAPHDEKSKKKKGTTQGGTVTILVDGAFTGLTSVNRKKRIIEVTIELNRTSCLNIFML